MFFVFFVLLDVERRKSHDTDLERTISSINDYKIVRVCSCVFQGSPGTQVMYFALDSYDERSNSLV